MAPTSLAVQPGQTAGGINLVLRLEGLVALALSVAAYRYLGGTWGLFALLFLLPDLSMLGYLAGPVTGARIYNAGHTYLSPAALLLAGLAAGRSDIFPIAAIWSAHIGFDRAMGYGLKYPTGFKHTHLWWQ